MSQRAQRTSVGSTTEGVEQSAFDQTSGRAAAHDAGRLAVTRMLGDDPTGAAPPKKPPKGIYSEAEFSKLENEYLDEKSRFVHYRDLKPGTSDDHYGCLATCLTNSKTLYPEAPSAYDDFKNAGLYDKGIVTKDAPVPSDSNTLGVDSWEYPAVMDEYNLGKKLFEYDLADQVSNAARVKFLKTFDYTSLPVGTVLSFGNARESDYIAHDAKSFRGKKEPLARHSAVVQGFVEGIDEHGKPSVDILIDDLGNLKRIGKSPLAQESWESYAISNKLMGAPRNSMGDWDYHRMKQASSPGGDGKASLHGMASVGGTVGKVK